MFARRARAVVAGIVALSLVGYSVPASAVPVSAQVPADKPNFLFLFADDFAPDAIAALGDRQVITPNLDVLVGQSTSFTNTYSQGAWVPAVCRSSRDMLEHGYFFGHAQTMTAARRDANQNATKLIAGAGYDTYFAGKLHMTNAPGAALTPAALGFQEVGTAQPAGFSAQDPNGGPDPYRLRPVEGELDPFDPADPAFGGFWSTAPNGGVVHATETLAAEGIGFLQQAAGDDSPFYIQLSLNAPHDPRQAPQKFLDWYPLADIEIPENFPASGLYEHAQGLGLTEELRDEALAPFPRTEFAIRTHLREYYAAISHMDEQIGLILAALDATEKRDNTYVFFAGDHGLAVGEHGLMGKQNMFEHSMRTPLLIDGPGVAAGESNDARVYYQDVMATMFDLAGVQNVPQDWQFKSLVPLLNNSAPQSYDAIFGAYADTQRMVIDDDHKLILYPELGVSLLYDLVADPNEVDDLVNDPLYAQRAHELFITFLDLQAEVGDTLEGLAAVFPELAADPGNSIRIEAESYDAATDEDPENAGGTNFAPPADVYPRASGPQGQRPGYVVGRTRDGESLTYADRTVRAGTWRIEASWASGYEPGPGGMVLFVDDVSVGSFDAAFGHWWQFEESLLAEVALTGPKHTLRVAFTDPGQINFDYLQLTRIGDLEAVRPGDVNCDGAADTSDVVSLLEYRTGLRSGVDSCPLNDADTEANVAAADRDGDATTTVLDAFLLLQCLSAPESVVDDDACDGIG